MNFQQRTKVCDEVNLKIKRPQLNNAAKICRVAELLTNNVLIIITIIIIYLKGS